MPLAVYGARGSEQAVQNIRDVLTARTQAVLLANHGVLCFAPNGPHAVQTNVIVEEAAQAAIYAAGIGGAHMVPPELLRASHTRAADFAARGTLRG